MNDFKKLMTLIESNKVNNNLSFTEGHIHFKIYTPSDEKPLIVYLTKGNTPIMQMVYISSDTVKLYFPKPHIPYEIGYNGYVFNVNDSFEKLLSKPFANNPFAHEAYDILKETFRRKQDD